MTFSVALVNISDGTVQGHKAGCADLTRGTLRRHADEAWTLDVEDKADAWLTYNCDFLAEGGEENAYSIDWKPCASHVTEGDTHTRYVEAYGEEHTPVAYQTPEPEGVVAKVGRKWTYLYLNGELIAEVLNEQATAVMAHLQTSR